MADFEIIFLFNRNQISAQDRQDIGQMLERLNTLKEARITFNLLQLKRDLNVYQKVHARRVKRYLNISDKHQ